MILLIKWRNDHGQLSAINVSHPAIGVSRNAASAFIHCHFYQVIPINVSNYF